MRGEAYPLDWANQPSVYKQYVDLAAQPLPPGVPTGLPPTLTLLRRLPEPAELQSRRPASVVDVAAMCHLAYGITAHKVYPGVTYDLRAAPSAGALFPCELYVCLRGVEGVADGVYHYAPGEHTLYCLREGDLMPYVLAALGEVPSLAGADIVFIVSAIWWRSAWKYRERAYRYCLHDGGHLLGNLLLAGEAFGRRAVTIYDFIDEEVNDLLGLDSQEAALALVACDLGEQSRRAPERSSALGPISPQTRPLSPQQVAYPLIIRTHAATCFSDVGELVASRGRTAVRSAWPVESSNGVVRLPPPNVADYPQPLAESVARRRSSRSFLCQPISAESLATLLSAAVGDYVSDQPRPMPSQVAVIVNDVGGIEPGVYHYDAEAHTLLERRQGDMRAWASYLSLEQRLCGNAAAEIFFLADLEQLGIRGGERSYRRVHLDAGLRGEFIYLAGQALGLGCSGIGAFYDDQTAEFLSAPPGTSVIYSLAVGHEAPDDRLEECV